MKIDAMENMDGAEVAIIETQIGAVCIFETGRQVEFPDFDSAVLAMSRKGYRF